MPAAWSHWRAQAQAEHQLLALWESAAALSPLDRDDALLGEDDAPPPVSLGRRNAALLQLRTRLMGQTLDLRCVCPNCASTAEFSVDCGALAQALLPGAAVEEPQALQHDGWQLEFRLPQVADLRHAARGEAAEHAGFGLRLLARCLLQCRGPDGRSRTAAELPEAVAEALSQRMENLEPGAHVSFDLTCPACNKPWAAPMDVGDVVWSELQARAESLLLDVDALARHYGWNEDEVLALGPVRRSAYLQLVQGT